MKIRIIAKQDGFRRCGLAHSKTPTDHPADAFTPEQLAALKADPMLIVEEVEGEVAGAESGEVIAPQTGTFDGEIKRLEDELTAAKEEISLIDADRDRLVSERNAAIDERQQLAGDLTSARSRIADLENQLSGLETERNDLDGSLFIARSRIAELEAQLKAALTAAPEPKKETKKGKD